MDLVENLVRTMNEKLSIMTKKVLKLFLMKRDIMFSKVLGFQKLVKHCQQEENPVILKANSCLFKKNECIIGYLPLDKTGNFAKTFYFLRADKYSICAVEITGKSVNSGDGEGIQFPCKLKLTRKSKFVNILQNSLKNKK